jgi:hypothetical protein
MKRSFLADQRLDTASAFSHSLIALHQPDTRAA